jgi:hypothetical protein
MRMIVTPVCASPARIARWIGAGARNSRKKEGGGVKKAPVFRRRQRRRREDQPIGHHDHRLDRELAQACDHVRRELGRLAQRKLQRRRALGDGRGLQGAAAPGGPVGLGVDGGDLVPGGEQGLEGGNGELRRAGEDQAHGRGLSRRGRRRSRALPSGA